MKNSIIPVLNELQNGLAVNELSEELDKLIALVKETNKTGSLTLAIKVKPRNGAKAVDVEYVITAKPPKQAPPSTFFYVNDKNGLQRNDPEQRHFDLKEVPKDEEEAPLREAASN